MNPRSAAGKLSEEDAGGQRSAPALADVLEVSDVELMLDTFAKLKPRQEITKVMGISQIDDGKVAKVFFKYMKAGRGGSVETRGELNCYKLNSGKWYCGGVYDLLQK